MQGRLNVSVPVLRQLLYKLSLEHLIRYIPCDHATVLFLHHDRLRPKNVNLDPDRYVLLKNSSMERMQKMTDYISEEDICRSAYLLDYFGQSESDDCGTCDVCRAGNAKRQDSSVQEDLEKNLSDFINKEMTGTYSLEDVARRFGSATADTSRDYLQVLRKMIDRGDVPAPDA